MNLVSTTELGRILGLSLTREEVVRLTGIPPVTEQKSTGATYWESHSVQNIARALVHHFMKVAGDKAPVLPSKSGPKVLPLPEHAEPADLAIGAMYELANGRTGFWDGERMQLLPVQPQQMRDPRVVTPGDLGRQMLINRDGAWTNLLPEKRWSSPPVQG